MRERVPSGQYTVERTRTGPLYPLPDMPLPPKTMREIDPAAFGTLLMNEAKKISDPRCRSCDRPVSEGIALVNGLSFGCWHMHCLPKPLKAKYAKLARKARVGDE